MKKNLTQHSKTCGTPITDKKIKTRTSNKQEEPNTTFLKHVVLPSHKKINKDKDKEQARRT